MNKQKFSPNLDIPAIDKRLLEIAAEKEALLRLKKQLLQQQHPLNTETFSSEEKLNIFKSLFKGRSDIFATRWESTRGKSGYSVACDNEWIPRVCNKPKVKCNECTNRHFSQLTEQQIYQHLTGKKTLGLYPLLPDNHCYLLAVDFDKDGWESSVKALSEVCSKYKIPHAIEISRSGNGAHLWIFFAEKIPAIDARLLGSCLLDKAMEYYSTLSFASYDRLFPNQDILPEGGFGNLIALPLQKEPRQLGYSSFVDSDLQLIDDQWLYLSHLKQLSRKQLTDLLKKLAPSSSRETNQATICETPPWEQSAKLATTEIDNCPATVNITLANHLYFKIDELPKPLIAQLRRLASFSNPVYYKTQALRFSTHGIPRFISCARIEQGYLSLPRGCFDQVEALLYQHNICIKTNDQRQRGQTITLQAELCLRKKQQLAVKSLIKHDTGILHAPTAFGKTVTAIGVILERCTNTLILTHSRQLVDQWKDRLNSFLPNAKIGIISGGRRKPTQFIDIATYQSLINKKDNTINELVQEYGQVIVDECHHVSSPRFEMVLNEVKAKYVLGLTATPDRQDGHQKIMLMLLGSIRHKAKQKHREHFDQEVIIHNLFDYPPQKLVLSNERPRISDVYRWITENDQRSQQIVEDAIDSIQQGKHPLILTERREHADKINTLFIRRGINSVILKGAMKTSERKNIEQRLVDSQVIVATGKYIGEGFDLPRLDTLFLAMPIAWKGSLAQYAGRIHRKHDGKTQVTIHDYVDNALPMLQRMFLKREKSYRAMGYKTSSFEKPEQQTLLSLKF